MVAFALGCNMQQKVKFDRKNYYYPDLPKNYQISQFDMPIAYDGKINITLDDGALKTIGVTRAHLEEDAGKLIHDMDPSWSFVDLNRTGTPLLEIVSEPDMRSPQEAYDYLTVLKRIIKYLGVSDCNMEEGSLRCDANISIRKKGETKLGCKVEIKNMNSFKAVRDALSFEEDRQMEALEEGEELFQETRLWDEKKSVTSSMRSKEGSHDYRYFPGPDLVPFEVKKDLVEEIHKNMPELPQEKSVRFKKEYKLSSDDIEILLSERSIADFFERVVKISSDAKAACNWIKGELMMHMKEKNVDIRELSIEPEQFSKIIDLAQTGKISGLAAKEVLAEYIETGKDPSSIVKEKQLEQVSNEDELESIIDKVILENEKSVNDYKNGKTNALGFLVGQVMRLSQGKANPKLANKMLKEKLD